MGRTKKVKSEEVLDLSLFTKSGKPRKRKQKTDKNYFTQETEDAIVKYVKLEDERERNKIFNEKIYYGLYKLVENIIHTFKFYYTAGDSIEELKHEVLVFLLERLPKYDPTQGKAYSYFGTIAKRYLITYNKNNYEKLKIKGELEEVDEDERVVVNVYNESILSDNIVIMRDYVDHIGSSIDNLFENDIDRDIAYTLLEIFRNREHIQIFNKQSFYLHIKETTGTETPQITKVIKILKSEYKKIQNLHYIKGDV